MRIVTKTVGCQRIPLFITHIITIETRSENDYALLKNLADRLGLHTEEAHIAEELSEAEALQLLKRVGGGWAGDETGDELNATLQNARHLPPA